MADKTDLERIQASYTSGSQSYEPSTEGTQAAQPERVFTERGFEDFANFRDTYGSLVTVRESSGASEFCVWIFCKDNPHIKEPSPHLNIEQAKTVIAALEAFVRRGTEDNVPAPVAQVDAGKCEHDENTLKSCPFCGGSAQRIETDDGGSVIECSRCKASSPVHYDRCENLISSWNERHSPAVAQTELPLIPDDLKADYHDALISAYFAYNGSKVRRMIERIASLTRRLQEQEAEVDRVREEFAAWTKGSTDRMEVREAELKDSERMILASSSHWQKLYVETADRMEALERSLRRISDWCAAYPVEVFPEPDLEADRKLLGDSEFTRLNAYSMRHVVEGIAQIAAAEKL